jgi:D-3-phosphoglycerate dehydrogenase
MSIGVCVGPDPMPEIVAAVREGGGIVVDAADAEAIVWLGNDPAVLAPQLHEGVRWVQLFHAGVENWLASGSIDTGRVWSSAASVFSTQVAEHALALMLAGVHRIGEGAQAERWEERFGGLLAGASVLIVGAGGIGSALIEMLGPFDVEIVAVTRRGLPVPGARSTIASARLGEEQWRRADVVVLAAPATPATRHLVDERVLRALPSNAWVVNVARGSLIDTGALVTALDQGWIGGAALDVCDPEPLPEGHPLWRHPRAILTPHAAAPPAQVTASMALRVRENVGHWLAGEPLTGAIDLQRGY